MAEPNSFNRSITNDVEKALEPGKATIVYGARQVGKTTLIKEIIERSKFDKPFYVNADVITHHEVLSSRDLNRLASFLEGVNLLVVDEAQRIPEIGINVKIIVDELNLPVLLSGSSALDLKSKTHEALTGRTKIFELFPLSFGEFKESFAPSIENRTLDLWLRFGSYPEVILQTGEKDKQEKLISLANSYVYKDIVDLGAVNNPQVLGRLLKLLAFQIGSEVSFDEIGRQLSISKNTVARYIDLLEQSYVIFKLSGFSRNLRKEVSKKPKIYFYDLGIRNAFLEDFTCTSDRKDLGNLWENFLLVERMKSNKYRRRNVHPYFWRTSTGAELDYIEEEDRSLIAFEFKYMSTRKKVRAYTSFNEAYSDQFPTFHMVTRENYKAFVL